MDGKMLCLIVALLLLVAALVGGTFAIFQQNFNLGAASGLWFFGAAIFGVLGASDDRRY